MQSLANKANCEGDSLYQKTVMLIAMTIARHGQYNAFCALADAVEVFNEENSLLLGNETTSEEFKTGQVIVKLVDSLKPLDVDYSNGNIEMRRKMVDELKKAILKLEVTE